jgi:hypothetical protein
MGVGALGLYACSLEEPRYDVFTFEDGWLGEWIASSNCLLEDCK